MTRACRHLSHVVFVCFVFGDDLHQRDARRSHPCEDRRDAETAHCGVIHTVNACEVHEKK